MNQILQWLSNFFGSWKFWVIIPPWDIGIRVRLGRNAVALNAGPHWRIPFLDEVSFVNTRLRIVSTPLTTVGTEQGKSRTVRVIIGYYIRDPLKAIMHFNAPRIAVQGYAQAQINNKCTPDKCLHALRDFLGDKGIKIEFVRFVEDVEAQTFRLLQESYGGVDGGDDRYQEETNKY